MGESKELKIRKLTERERNVAREKDRMTETKTEKAERHGRKR